MKQDPPFVRREYRSNVSKTTLEQELEHRRKQAIFTVETEISIMRERATICTQKQSKLEEDIRKYFENTEDDTAMENVLDKLSTQEQ